MSLRPGREGKAPECWNRANMKACLKKEMQRKRRNLQLSQYVLNATLEAVGCKLFDTSYGSSQIHNELAGVF